MQAIRTSDNLNIPENTGIKGNEKIDKPVNVQVWNIYQDLEMSVQLDKT